MSLLLYSDIAYEGFEKLKNVVKSQVPDDEIVIYHDINSLSNQFYQLRGNISIMVLVATTQNDLIELILKKHLFDDIPIILILPDRNNETISKGLKLYPRFFDYIDSNFSNVALVLNKMMKKIRIQYKKLYETQENIDACDKEEAKNIFAL